MLLLDEDSSRESHDGQEDVDAVRSNTADNEQTKSSSPSLSWSKDGSSTTTTADGLKPAFWMTDYKQPKRCKKGNCTFQTVSKVSKMDLTRRRLFASVSDSTIAVDCARVIRPWFHVKIKLF